MRCTLIVPARTTLLMIAALTPTLTAGCGGEEPSGATVVEELRGDTVVMVSSGEPERVRIDEVEVLWQSHEFEGLPMRTRMVRLGDDLVIGDMWRIHVVSLQDGSSHTFGRQGEGPGEFGQPVWSVGGFGTDTISAFDGLKVLLFSLDGEFLTSYQTSAQLPFRGQVTGAYHGGDRPVYPLVRSGSGVLWERASHEIGADGSRTERTALLWHDLEADTAVVLEIWDLIQDSSDLFGELVKHVIASDDRVATGYPADYCIRLFQAFEEGGRMGCRVRSRVPVEAGFNDPSSRNPVDVLPHFSRLLFSGSGDLWVHLYHEEFAHVHRRSHRASGGDWEPTVHEWEVFDREAVLVRHVTLPGAFDLRVIGDGEGFGFLTLETGEIVVGRVDLTEFAMPPG